MQRIHKNIANAFFLPSLFVVSCGGDETAPDGGSQTIVDRAFDDYGDRDEARAYCAARDDDDDTNEQTTALEGGDLLLFDVTPQCDPDRFGDELLETGELALALCSCTKLEASNRIMAPGESDIIGDLGANEEIFGSAPIRVDGQVISGGTVRFDNRFEANQLHVNGVLEASNDVTVLEDASVGGLDIPGNRVEVGGTLTVPDGSDTSSVESSDEILYADVTVPPPCDCSQDIDYDELREEFRDVDGDGNDDFDDYDAFAHEFDEEYLYPAPPYLLQALDEDRTVHLSCGKYYFESIDSASNLTLIAVGDVDVFVDGDVNVAGALVISTEEDSSLDFYVNGAFTPDNTVDLGTPQEPHAFRMYVRDEVVLAGPTVLSGALFAPRADVVFNNTLETEGAIFGGMLDFAGPIQVTDGPRFTSDACLIGDNSDGSEQP